MHLGQARLAVTSADVTPIGSERFSAKPTGPTPAFAVMLQLDSMSPAGERNSPFTDLGPYY